MNVHAIIMAGGGGTRFWPRSRARRPKQFLALTRSLLQQACDRLGGVIPPGQTWVITAGAQAELVREQLPELSADQLVAEPLGRDTAACIALGAALVSRADPEAIMVVTPADHVIEPAALFQSTLHAAVQLAQEHPRALITLGIPPTFPATGYGYIHRGPALPSRNGIEAFRLLAFKEKPALPDAERYLHGGEHFWNSGIFIWKASAILAELQRLRPELAATAARIAAAWSTPRQAEVFEAEYAPLARISIDHAVMEHCQEALVLRAPFTWDDLGSWPALTRHQPQDAAGNTVLDTQHLGLDTRQCIIVGDGSDQLIATAGLSDLLIVRDGGAVLVADQRDEAAIKRLVELLKAKGLERFL
ncbi:MAG TPA: mannose-1-phosphate guanylyltransferase [Gemmatales bacterium]|nr:mannose-1-phosphate guanylyltransferase [Gemmatales bacterium]